MVRRITFGFAVLAVSAASSAQFFDDFNRADGGLGANYTNVQVPAVQVLGNKAAGTATGNGMTLVNSGVFSGSYSTTPVSADLSLSDQSGSLAYCALILGSDGSVAGSHGLFIKLQRQANPTGFDFIGAYTGAGVNTTAIALNGGNFQALPTIVDACRMTVWCTSATDLNIGLDTDFNGVNDILFTGTLNLGLLVTGPQVGLHIFGTTGRIDNFQAGVVPEPCTMAVLGLGAAALIRRRRK